MKRKAVLFVVVITLLLAGLLLKFYGGGQAPRGQTALVALTPSNYAILRQHFNAAREFTRVVALLSPT